MADHQDPAFINSGRDVEALNGHGSRTIGSRAVAVVRLTKVFRQAAQSQIVINAQRINAGRMPLLTPPRDGEASDFCCMEAGAAEDALRGVVDIM
jgi:exodeoxyribonuclease V alpha subunit